MSWDDCLDTIRKAAGKALSDDDIHQLLEDVQLRADRMSRERVDLSRAELLVAAAREAGDEARMAARIETRNAKMNLVKRVTRREFYNAAPTTGSTPGIIMGLEAKLVGVNTPFAGSRLSVAAQQHALRRDYAVGLTTELERAGLYNALRNGTIDREIARELFAASMPDGRPGITGVQAAQQAAEIIRKYQQLAVHALNKEGAWIGQYDGYISRTVHDSDRILAAQFEGWRDTVLPLLDERTFEGVADREGFLRGVWHALATGVHLTPEGGQGLKDPAFKGPANIAKKASQGRVLHWKDADAWMDYQAKFGEPNLIHAVLRSLDNAARNAALMREFGTNPRAEFEADLRALAEQHRDTAPEVVVQLQQARGWLSNRFDELDGRASMPVHRLGAQVGAAVRTWESMSKLGGVTLSAVTDVPLKASELRYQGIGLLEGYADGLTALVRGRGKGEEGEIIDLLRAGAEGMTGNLASRFEAGDTVPGTLSKLANTFFRWSGISYWTDAQRAGAEFVMSRHLGRQVDQAWDGLQEQTRRILSMFDIKPEDWEMIRTAELRQVDGRPFVTPDAALRLADEAVDARIAPELDAIRSAIMDRLETHAGALERLEERSRKLEAELAKAGPTMDDAERAAMEATVAGVRRYQDTISSLREALRDHRDSARSTTEVGQRIAREIGALARAERDLATKAANRVRRITEGIPKAEAARAELAAKLERAQVEMVERIDAIAALPGRLDEQVARARDGFREDLALKLHAYFADRGEYAVLNPGARERAMLRQGTQAGTVAGEALRFVTQFKAFPVAMVTKVWGREVYGGQDAGARAAGIVHMMLGSTVFGYVAGALKDLAKGRTPRDPADPETWAAAWTQGGALGIYGDYLFGHYSRFGNVPLETAAGPTASSVADLLAIWSGLRNGDDKRAGMLRWAVSNTPFANLFYTRIGLDYLFLYQVQEALNPGFLRRFEKRVKEENAQKFIFSPAAAIPYGGGNRFAEGLRS
ncbi:hypothetical protein [Azospirillum sp. sgz302134]